MYLSKFMYPSPQSTARVCRARRVPLRSPFTLRPGFGSLGVQDAPGAGSGWLGLAGPCGTLEAWLKQTASQI
jgi:hypothetical protein